MENGKLNPFQESELKYLRQQVDRLQEEENRRDAHFNAKRDLWVARDELNNFVQEMRKAGVNI